MAHAVETAKIATVIAAELNADIETTRLAALLHDLGKAVDHTMEGTHAQLGFLVGYLLASWAMLSIASIAFFFSTFVENAIGPIISTMGVNMIFVLITVLPLDFFKTLKPYLFTHYLNVWLRVFEDPVPWQDIATGCFALGAYVAGFVVAAWLIFRRKDILT